MDTITAYAQGCASVPKIKINYFNSPRNKPLIVLGYWSKNIEVYSRLCNPDNINQCEKPKTHNVKNEINSMVKHVKYMEQGMILIQ